MDRKLTYEEYIDKELNEYERELRENPNRKTYTMEESNAMSEKLLDDIIRRREQKRCIS